VYHNVTRKRPPTEETDEDRKERVIHTRVPEKLEAELRQRAQGLGISVSNLVRNVLGHAFGLVGDVVADSHAIARAARGEARGPATDEPDEVIAWQPIVLAKNAICSRCNDILPKGSKAAIAIGGDRAFVCTKCLEELSQ
jgi:hypothetical protein